MEIDVPVGQVCAGYVILCLPHILQSEQAKIKLLMFTIMYKNTALDASESFRLCQILLNKVWGTCIESNLWKQNHR